MQRRNVRVDIPNFKYVRVRHDEGNYDMLSSIKAFADVS